MSNKRARENGENVPSFRGIAFVANDMGWPWTRWIGPAPVQMSRCCLGAALSWLCDGLLRGFGRFSLTSRFSWTVTLVILGLGFLRARLLRLCCTAAFLPIFLQPRKGPLWSCAELLQSGALCCVDQCGTVKSRPPKMRGPRTVLGYVGKRGWGVEGYWCLRKWVQWSPSIGGAKCDWLRRTKETCKASCVCISSLRGRCRAVVPGVLACVHMCILYVCVYICVCVYVCGHVYMYVYACVYVYVYVCVYTHVYVYVCAYLCIDCGSQYQCFSVWTVSCMYVWYMCVYACICIWMRTCVYDIAWHVEALLLRFSICAYMCICMRMYMCVHVCVYRCMCICMYMYVCMSVYMYAYTFIYTRVWVYICTRVGAFCLFVLSNLSTTCTCITGVS